MESLGFRVRNSAEIRQNALRRTVWLTLIAAELTGSLAHGAGERALFEQQTAESAEVVQDAAAGCNVAFQLCEFEVYELKGLLAAFRAVGAGKGNVGLYIRKGLSDCIGQHGDILMRAFNVVERGFQSMIPGMAHGRSLLQILDSPMVA
jgi:hypothetical protein